MTIIALSFLAVTAVPLAFQFACYLQYKKAIPELQTELNYSSVYAF